MRASVCVFKYLESHVTYQHIMTIKRSNMFQADPKNRKKKLAKKLISSSNVKRTVNPISTCSTRLDVFSYSSGGRPGVSSSALTMLLRKAPMINTAIAYCFLRHHRQQQSQQIAWMRQILKQCQASVIGSHMQALMHTRASGPGTERWQNAARNRRAGRGTHRPQWFAWHLTRKKSWPATDILK